MDETYEIIELFAFHEEAIGNLYSVLSVYFPETDLWKELAKEEFKHAGWIRSILDNVNDGSVEFDKKYFSIDYISRSIDAIVDFRAGIEKNGIKLTEVLDYAIGLENSIIQKRMLGCFSSRIKGIQKVLDDLEEDTRQHRIMLENRLEQLKRSYQNREEKRKNVDDSMIVLGYHAEHERVISQLYTLYKNKFPKDGIWSFLTEEEKKHEAWIKQIIRKVNEDVISFDHRESDIASVKLSVNNIVNEMKRVSDPDYSAEEAILFAYRLENSMIEKHIFNLMDSDAPFVKDILIDLSEDTKEHRDLLKEKREEYIFKKNI